MKFDLFCSIFFESYAKNFVASICFKHLCAHFNHIYSLVPRKNSLHLRTPSNLPGIISKFMLLFPKISNDLKNKNRFN